MWSHDQGHGPDVDRRTNHRRDGPKGETLGKGQGLGAVPSRKPIFKLPLFFQKNFPSLVFTKHLILSPWHCSGYVTYITSNPAGVWEVGTYETHFACKKTEPEES